MKVKILLCAVSTILSVVSGFNLIHPKTQQLLDTKYPPILMAKQDSITKEVFAKVRYIEQYLDNFNPQNIRTWQQRVFYFDEFYAPGGPIIVFPLGFDSGYIEFPELLTLNNHLYEIANRTNGIVYYLENRYLGESRPTEDLSMENLRYLTVEQSMADYALAIQQIKNELAEMGTEKVFLFGYSTSAMMATWIRLKYPHLVDGVWASSAPLYTIMEYSSYFIHIGMNLRLFGGDECHDRIERAFQRMDDLIESGNTTYLEELFNLYDPIDRNDPQDVGVFFSTFAKLMAFALEYGKYVVFF